ncbi:MAG: hypothetical protein QM753_11510 [Thermomicrobiales bacterium]
MISTVMLHWARAALWRSNSEEGARRFAALRRRAPKLPEAYTEGGDLLSRLGRDADAVAVLTEGLRRFPESRGIWQSAAMHAERQTDPEAAVQAWAAFREHFPSATIGFVLGAKALARAGRTEEADQLLAVAVTFFPGNKDVAAAREAAVRNAQRAPA